MQATMQSQARKACAKLFMRPLMPAGSRSLLARLATLAQPTAPPSRPASRRTCRGCTWHHQVGEVFVVCCADGELGKGWGWGGGFMIAGMA